MTITINGVDFSSYIPQGGIKWQRNDVTSTDAERTLDGLTHRGRITSKATLEITCRPLKLSEASIVLKAIQPEYVTVTYSDPMEGEEVTKTMYSDNSPATFLLRRDGVDYWSGITFPLVER